MVGGGQLARMMQEEASALGLGLRVLVEAADGSAGQVTVDAPVGAADDEAAVRALVDGAQVLTFEHEHQDSALLETLQGEGVSVQPTPRALELARDKLAMRRAMEAAGLPQPAWAQVAGSAEQMAEAIASFAAEHGWPVVLKTPRGGYDGHGVLLVHGREALEEGEAASWLAAVAAAGAVGSQAAAETGSQFEAASAAGSPDPDGQQGSADRQGPAGEPAQAPSAGGGGSLGGGAVSSLLVEQAIPFTRELAVLIARSPSGQVEAWPVAQTLQENGMCAEVIAPAPGLDSGAADEAEAIGREVAERFGVTGVLAVELFAVERFGEPTRLYINELAMRPHNSGHWTQDGAVTSQFAQHLRAVLDLPLGSGAAVAPTTVMVNVIGGAGQPGQGAVARAMAAEPAASIHLYGKDWRPGRKLGHVSMALDDPHRAGEAIERLREVAAILGGQA
ncbi:5-(carboxyamino)imidazole ribonucleotide synthase [Actinomyces slackii]|uniref:N5-carboxyaminoimidazole ribonucleotide synthase n=1 Tax=Actinomyces slackii TaxID=52774 RepID=A0A448KG88_9ACTO|nr:N5-carboxyaminoimidazole ribonucleotide synthase [Actinomyces slackii]